MCVKKRVALYREFGWPRLTEARAYIEQFGRAGHQATLKQLATAVQLVYRERGHRPLVHTFDSRKEAENAASVIRAQRVQKVYVDYGESWRYTSAQLITRYIREECSKHRGGDSERYRLQVLLRNAHPAFDPAHDPAAEPGKNKRNRCRGALVRHAAWLNKPLAWVKPIDIEEYIEERLEQVSPDQFERAWPGLG